MKMTLLNRLCTIGFCFTVLASPRWMWGSDVTNTPRPKIYDASADGPKQIADALATAKKNDKHVLLQIGGDWCVPCIKLHSLLETNRAINDVLKTDYVVALIECNERNRFLLTNYQAVINYGLPIIIIIDADGKCLVTKNTEELWEGALYSPAKVLEFLNEWTPRAFRAKSINQWVTEFLSYKNSDLAFQIILARPSESVPLLIDAIKNKPSDSNAGPDVEVRLRAYQTLATIAPASTVPFLAQQFISDAQLRDCLRAILSELGPTARAAIPVLTNAFHSSDRDLQFRAAWALSHIDPGYPELTPTMVAWLKGSNVVSRRGATTVLGDLGPTANSALPALVEALTDPDGTVRRGATNAIAKIDVDAASRTKGLK